MDTTSHKKLFNRRSAQKKRHRVVFYTLVVIAFVLCVVFSIVQYVCTERLQKKFGDLEKKFERLENHINKDLVSQENNIGDDAVSRFARSTQKHDPKRFCQKVEKCQSKGFEMMQLVSPNIIPTDVPLKGLIKHWTVEDSTGLIQYQNGVIKIEVEGYYSIYAQMKLSQFQKITDFKTFQIFVNGKSLAAAITNSTDSTFAVTRVILLRKGDEVSLHADDGKTEWWSVRVNMFFGVYLVQVKNPKI